MSSSAGVICVWGSVVEGTIEQFLSAADLLPSPTDFHWEIHTEVSNATEDAMIRHRCEDGANDVISAKGARRLERGCPRVPLWKVWLFTLLSCDLSGCSFVSPRKP